jgi:hypothetical protein
MSAPIPEQTVLPDLPADHLKRGASCELCGAELPYRDPSMRGQKQRWCRAPFHGGRASCGDILEALKRLEHVLPPTRTELRKLKQKRLKRRSKALTPEEEARMQELLAEIGPEYPEAVRRATKARILNLANRFNSNGWGSA